MITTKVSKETSILKVLHIKQYIYISNTCTGGPKVSKRCCFMNQKDFEESLILRKV